MSVWRRVFQFLKVSAPKKPTLLYLIALSIIPTWYVIAHQGATSWAFKKDTGRAKTWSAAPSMTEKHLFMQELSVPAIPTQTPAIINAIETDTRGGEDSDFFYLDRSAAVTGDGMEKNTNSVLNDMIAPETIGRSEPVRYGLPIAAGQMYVDWFIGSYVDKDVRSRHMADYGGGFMVLDGHRGTDFVIRDLAHMEEGVPVLAARAGEVIALHDGEDDWGSEGTQSNLIKILHEDGSFAVYSHLKRESQMVKIGESVKTGQPIAQVGHSGSSAHPHLHFEIHEKDGRIVDIFDEQLVAFDYPYPSDPFIFASGITRRSDPNIFANLSLYTPSHNPVLAVGENPYIWYKVVGMARGDQLRTVLVYADGTEERLYTFTAEQDYRYVYRYVYGARLPIGTYLIKSYFNDNAGSASMLSFQVVED